MRNVLLIMPNAFFFMKAAAGVLNYSLLDEGRKLYAGGKTYQHALMNLTTSMCKTEHELLRTAAYKCNSQETGLHHLYSLSQLLFCPLHKTYTPEHPSSSCYSQSLVFL